MKRNLVGKSAKGREKGTAVLEMAAILPLAVVLLAGVLTLGPYVHIGIATQQASYDCAVAAAQSLDSSQGGMQGIAAAQASFQAFRLNNSRASYSLAGNWERNGWVECSVSYSVPLGAFPLKEVVSMPEIVQAHTVLPVQVFKSEWR